MVWQWKGLVLQSAAVCDFLQDGRETVQLQSKDTEGAQGGFDEEFGQYKYPGE